eukprot:1193417-Prorocentrum_minimum.AAC.1
MWCGDLRPRRAGGAAGSEASGARRRAGGDGHGAHQARQPPGQRGRQAGAVHRGRGHALRCVNPKRSPKVPQKFTKSTPRTGPRSAVHTSRKFADGNGNSPTGMGTHRREWELTDGNRNSPTGMGTHRREWELTDGNGSSPTGMGTHRREWELT